MVKFLKYIKDFAAQFNLLLKAGIESCFEIHVAYIYVCNIISYALCIYIINVVPFMIKKNEFFTLSVVILTCSSIHVSA